MWRMDFPCNINANASATIRRTKKVTPPAGRMMSPQPTVG